MQKRVGIFIFILLCKRQDKDAPLKVTDIINSDGTISPEERNWRALHASDESVFLQFYTGSLYVSDIFFPLLLSFHVYTTLLGLFSIHFSPSSLEGI